jgi:hypothetical protein
MAWRLLFCAMVSVPMALHVRAQIPPADQTAIQSADYESFCKQDAATKKILVAKMKPDQCVALTRTQRERWLDANRTNLTPEQIGAIQDWIKTIRPTDCSMAIIEQDMARAKAFEKPPIIFTRAQLDEMSLAGPCIAKKTG